MVTRPDMHTLSVEARSISDAGPSSHATIAGILMYRRHGKITSWALCIFKDMLWTMRTANAPSERQAVAPPFEWRRVLREVLIVPENPSRIANMMLRAAVAPMWAWRGWMSWKVFCVSWTWKMCWSKWSEKIHDELTPWRGIASLPCGRRGVIRCGR